jgi:endo-1,4-beta-xylanase
MYSLPSCADGLRRDALSAQLGSEYIDIAFHAARRAFPKAQLLLNDYGMEQEGANMQRRREALLGMLDAARKAGTPIDGVGLQAHLTLGRAFDAASFTDFLHQIASRGMRIVITELDVLDISAPAAATMRDREVASLYRRFLDAALQETGVAALITWGLSDRDTWLTPASNRHFARSDGLPTRPLPFDRDLQPKLSYFAIRDSLSHAPLRQPV